MRRTQLTLAISDYDHVRDLVSGRVVPEGIELVPLILSVEEIFYRFTRFREWDVSEMSFAKYVALRSQGDDSLTAIPVFPSRIFRQSSIYVHEKSDIGGPEDLRGRKVGIPEWAQTAGMYVRGWLMHQIGLELRDIQWVQAGVNEPGRVEKVELRLPDGIAITAISDRTLSDLLLTGEIDAVITAHPPRPFELGEGGIVRLFPDYRAVEERYWQETGIFPIMHVVALRAEALRGRAWIAMNLLKAFEEAKDRSVRRMHEVTATRVPIPWCFAHAQDGRRLFGGVDWPYGVDSNRVTLEALLSYAHEQGISHRRLAVEDLFPPEVLSFARV